MITHFVVYLLNEWHTHSCHLIPYYYLVCLLIFSSPSCRAHTTLCAAFCCLIVNVSCSTRHKDTLPAKMTKPWWIVSQARTAASFAPVYDFVCFSLLRCFLDCFFFASLLLGRGHHSSCIAVASVQYGSFVFLFWWICTARKDIPLKKTAPKWKKKHRKLMEQEWIANISDGTQTTFVLTLTVQQLFLPLFDQVSFFLEALWRRNINYCKTVWKKPTNPLK